MIKVILADDHAVVRAGYRLLLQNSDEIEIVAEVETGEQTCRTFVESSPDVVVMDLSMPGMGGLEAIRRITIRDASAKILVFSMHENTVFVDQALKAGAKGYITKNSAPDVLVNAIKEIAAGGTFIDSDIAQHLAFQKARDNDEPFSGLSTREFEIFCLLAEGSNTSQIAKRLSLSYKTVANYTTQIKNKLDVKTVAELARLALSHNIVQL
jgi:two-component system, NarL family, invasion response regulator UvrY